MKDNNIDDWLAQLRNPSECESDREKTVMGAIKSGLGTSEELADVDELALQRLHRRIEQEGLYQQPNVVKRRRNLHRYGYAAALLVGLTIILDVSVFKDAKQEALIAAADSVVQSRVMVSSPQMSEDAAEEQAFESSEAMSGEQYLAATARDDAQQEASAKSDRLASAPTALAKRQSKATSQEFAADASRAKAALSQKVASEERRLVLTATQWQALLELSDNGISLDKGDDVDRWVLLLNSNLDGQRWREALPLLQREQSWPIGVKTEFELELRGDRNE
ncbi:hypothetical protein [Zhongshania sp.]|uniref:hypothetical protein n=1 Tax=Zhongshania sp. TaxID=1971902 RepID=UPI001B3E604A|nr:hypothetical protein [Zhongshania sp.]MBQ0760388.1 hypothetical protein [Zhongshania sp.]MBQ0794994.1 hypothetical protein [Zhongshania sp.]